MSFLLKLREAAAECSNIDYRAMLRGQADQVQRLILMLQNNPTEETMRALNGVWALAERSYKNLPPEGTPAPLSGAPEPARLAV
jgi:hypothetical protein